MLKIRKCFRYLSVLVCCCCLLFWCAAAPASAVAGFDDLVIGGTAVMTLGLVTAFTMISMSAAGMTPSLQAAAQAAQKDVKEFAGALFDSYAKSQNITAGQAVQIAQQGTSYLEDGRIIFNDKMSELMSGFLNWAWDADGGNLIEYGTISSSEIGTVEVPSDNSLNLGEFQYSVGIASANASSTGSGYYKFIDFSVPVRLITTETGTIYVCYTEQISGVSYNAYFLYNGNTTIENGNVNLTSSYTLDGKTVYYGRLSTSFKNDNKPYTPVSTTSSNINQKLWIALYGGYTLDGGDYDVNLDVLKDVGSGQVGVFDPDSVVSIPDAPVAGGTIAIDDWLNALADSIAVGVASIPIAIDDATTVDVAMELASDDAMPLEVTANPPAGGDQIADSSDVSTLDPYTLDLIDFFPFCIPFDIYDMLSAFSAERHAPRFDYRFYIPNLCDETITIDLSPFDGVASVLRTVELVAFAIGLAFVTKKLIQGGD